MDKTPEKRKPLKHGTPTGSWKKRFREGCLQRMKEKRYNLVKNLRQTGAENDESPPSSQELINEVMVDEWGKMRLESPLLSMFPGCQYLEQYDTFSFEDDGFENINEVLQVFEDIQKELLREEQKMLRQYEDTVDFDEKYLCAAIDLLSTESVTCPICRRNNLCQNRQIIFCCCGLRIDTENDSIDLNFVHKQLKDATNSHSINCSSEPEFSVLDLSGTNMRNMVMTCQTCDYMGVII